MDNCCDWHGSLIAENLTEQKHNQPVTVNIYFCPECNSIWKTITLVNEDKDFLSEHLWGPERDKYITTYQEQIKAIQRLNK